MVVSELVRVIFTGICTFVEADVGDNNRPLTAVFANGSHHKPAHEVNMVISEDDYEIETDLPFLSEYSQLGKAYRVIPLEGKNIVLLGVAEETACNGQPWAGGLCLSRPPLGQTAEDEKYPTTVTEMTSVEWIPSLGRSWPRMFPLRAARRMKPEFYRLRPDPHLVSASFELPKGKLESHWVSGDIWRFSPRSRTRLSYETAVAQEVRLDATIGTPVMSFDVCDLSDLQHCGYVRIWKRGAADPEPIQVVISNVPKYDRLPEAILFCGECGRSECELGERDPSPCTCVDHHYAQYYNALSSDTPARPSLPRRVDVKRPIIPVAMRVGGINCPPNDYP